MSLGIFESTMAYLETIFEFFDFGHSKPLFQPQNEVVSTIPGFKMSEMGVCKGISKHWVDFNDLDNLWTLWMPSERYIYELIHFRRSKYADFRLNIRAQTMKLTEDNEDALLMFLSDNAPLKFYNIPNTANAIVKTLEDGPQTTTRGSADQTCSYRLKRKKIDQHFFFDKKHF